LGEIADGKSPWLAKMKIIKDIEGQISITKGRGSARFGLGFSTTLERERWTESSALVDTYNISKCR